MREEVLKIAVAGADGAAVGEKKTRRVAIGRFAGVFLIYTTQPDTCVVNGLGNSEWPNHCSDHW